jgi:hypothetical protein
VDEKQREREREIKRHNDIERSNAEGIEKEIEWQNVNVREKVGEGERG